VLNVQHAHPEGAYMDFVCHL